jgi:WD40 repeat protein/serine/threonine protein kinase
MSGDQATPQEEHLSALLADFDEALQTGSTPAAGRVPPEMRHRFNEDVECLQLLRQLWRGSPSAPASQQSDATGPAARYTLSRLHAVGGIGQVWLAHDADLGRDVALKELRPDRAQNPTLVARFLREAHITGQLQHPGILPVYELVSGRADAEGESGEEMPFYTMRFVNGRTLSDAARDYHAKRAARTAGPLDLAVLLGAFVSACHTVAYAHSRGIIHRDLKGQNVELGEFGEVIVLDWGFAKLLNDAEEVCGQVPMPDPAAPAEHTQAGQVLGTPAYMAPEQAAGRLDLIDCRTDVYGLGAILYEILTGRAPFVGDDTREVLQRVREETPPRPETVWTGVPPALVAICLRALERDPAQRYASAAELAREVQHWLADEPVAAYREPPTARARRFARRHKPIVAGLTALLTAATAALVVGAFLLEQQQTRTSAALTQAALDKAVAAGRANQALELQMYYKNIALAERELADHNLNRATQLLAACPVPLRGWEWYCLKRLCHADVLTLYGHVGDISAVAFSPDGRHLASAGHDQTVRIWDLANGKAAFTLTQHRNVVYGLAYSPDGARLATASWDGTVKVWDAALGRELLTFRGHDQQVNRVTFSPDGRWIASLSGDKVLVWDAATGEVLQTFEAEDGWMHYGLAYSPDGQRVAVTAHKPPVILWNVTTGRVAQVIEDATAIVKNLAYSPDGRFLAGGGGDLVRREPGEVDLWEAGTGKLAFRLRGHTDAVFCVTFSPDGRRLVSASQDHTAKIWDVDTGYEALTLRAHADTVRAVAFNQDGTRLATASADGTIKVWDATPWSDATPLQQIRSLAGHGAAVFGVAFYPDGRRLAAVCDNGTIRTWDAEAGHELRTETLATGPQLYALAVSPDGSLLATATKEGTVKLLDAVTLQVKQTLQGHPVGPVKGLAFSPDGRRLALGHWWRAVWVWDLASGKVVQTLEGHEDAVVGVAYSPDGKWLASASRDRTVRVWNAATGQVVHVLTGHTSRVHAVAFSPDSRTLASASNDGTIRLWDVERGELQRTLEGHSSGVYGVAFSPDGRSLASASNDWTVRLWDVATGTVICSLGGHGDRVHGVAFSPDGRRLASCSSDETVRIWEPQRSAAPPRP